MKRMRYRCTWSRRTCSLHDLNACKLELLLPLLEREDSDFSKGVNLGLYGPSLVQEVVVMVVFGTCRTVRVVDRIEI
jgi:hypothetical protein